jgi:hypothetical protein
VAGDGRFPDGCRGAGQRPLSERLPAPDPARIAATAPRPDELVNLEAGSQLVRIHLLGGPYPCAWNEFRAYGPTTSRFDHHTLPRRVHPSRSIAYLASGDIAFTTVLAEYFQDQAGYVGPIDRRRSRPAATLIELAGPLTLLDLDSGWVTRASGNQAIRTGPRSRSRDWARAIYRHHNVDGLAYGSSVWGPGRCVALWDRAQRALPAAPVATRTLDDPSIAPAIAAAAIELGTIWI